MDAGTQPPARALPQRKFFKDSDELAASFASWGMALTQLTPESGTHWTASTAFGSLSLWTTALTGGYRVKAAPPKGTVLLQLDMAASGSRRLGRTNLAGDDILVAVAGAELDGVVSGRHHGMSFALPWALVDEALALRAPEGGSTLLRTDSPYVIADCAANLAGLRGLAARTFDFDGPHPASLFAVDALIDSLVDALVAPWRCEAAPLLRVPRSHSLPIVRRVEEYMRENLGSRLMLHDLCRVARASQRSVEYAFSATYGVGPKQYLKLLRLNEVRRRLKSQPRELGSIAGIAHLHGFWHMGHFQTDYRRLFGESPSQTRIGAALG